MSASVEAPPSQPASNASHRRLGRDLALILAIGIGAHFLMSRNAIGGAAPTLEGTGIDGAALSLAALKGQPVLVQFWATWCGVCHQEAPNISALARDHRVLTVAVQSGPADRVARFAEQQAIHWATLADPTGEVSAAWGVSAFPSSFILDGHGQIRFVEVGYTTELGLRARLWLAGLVG